MTFLVTRPDHDDVVFYLCKWCEELIEVAKEKGFSVLDCFGEKAVKAVIVSMISKQRPKIIMFNGHGDSNVLLGHKDKVIIEAGVNDDVLKGALVYALACSTSAGLGKNKYSDA